MSRLRVTLYYRASEAAYLFLTVRVIQRTWAVEQGGYAFEIAFPETPKVPIDAPQLLSGTKLGAGTEEWSLVGHGVRFLEASTTFDDPLDANAAERALAAEGSKSDSDLYNAAHDRLQDVAASAATAVTRFLDWVKVEQPWVGPIDGRPERVARALVVDLDLSEQVDLDVLPDPNLLIAGVQPPGKGAVSEIEHALQTGKQPPIARSLLADAQYSGLWSKSRDPKRAVMLGAAACELVTKDFLRSRAAGGNADRLLKLLLPTSGPSLVTIEQLWDSVLRAVTGRSLKEDDPSLYDEVRGLITSRNHLAHRGVVPTVESAAAGVRAGRRLFDYLQAFDSHGATAPNAQS